MNRYLLSGLLVAGLSMGGGAQAAGDAEAGKKKAASCAACHGPDGNALAPTFPKIAGQHADYIVKQLRDFKEGKTRKNASMSPMALPLSEQDMEDIAAFYATQEAKPGVAAEENLEMGQAIYRGGIAETGVAACMACHGPAGKGNPGASYPALSGQHATYTASTLREFRSGQRHNDVNNVMRGVAKRMTDQEIDAVANYIQGLQ